MGRVLAAIAVISMQLLHSPILTEAFKDVTGKIRIRLFQHNSRNYHELPLEQGHFLFRESEGYNHTKPIVLIVHGMAMGADSPFVNGVVDAFAERQIDKDYNIFALDMPELFENSLINEFYIGVLRNVKPAGNTIGKFLNKIINYGLTTPEKINMISYSMGVQVAGYAARLVKEVFGEIHFILGLDPAGPGFHALFGKVARLTHVSKADAKITHFYHTNSISCGTRDRVGTADFVFNNGGTQPGCFADTSLDCSHIRVPYLFIEAIANPGNLVARHCSSWTEFSGCHCNHHERAVLNFPPDEKAHGIYYLRTHAKSPFGMGNAGARCPNIIHPTTKNGYHAELTKTHDPVLKESKIVLKDHKPKSVLRPHHHHRHMTKDNLNVHIINGIRKMEELHGPPMMIDHTLSLKEAEMKKSDQKAKETVLKTPEDTHEEGKLIVTHLNTPVIKKETKDTLGSGYLVTYGNKEAEKSEESGEKEEDDKDAEEDEKTDQEADKAEKNEEELQSLQVMKTQD